MDREWRTRAPVNRPTPKIEPARDKESKVPPDKEGCDDRVFVHLIIHTPTTIQGGREHYELLPKLWNSPFSRKREEDRRVG